jgi:pyrroloquinoline quinone biosynthesis protein B
MLRLIVLGAAAGGGVPQWNCNCPQCRAARADVTLARTQASLAVSADGRDWFLVNATPDLRQQVNATPALHPRAGTLRDSPLAGVILTSGEIDAIAGLLVLRENAPFTIHAHPHVLAILAANPIFAALDPVRVPRHALEVGLPFEPRRGDGSPSGLVVEAFPVPGKVPLYLEGMGGAAGEHTLGLELRDAAGTARCHVIPGCAEVDAALAARLRGSPLVFFDGTVWQDDELIAAGLGSKTGRRMGHLAMSGAGGAMAALGPLDIGRKVFIHINNSNPALTAGSPQQAAAAREGWIIPADGTEFRL